jgi:hypothetical protein
LKRAAASTRGDDFTNQCPHGNIAKAHGQRVAAERQEEMIHTANA